MNDAERNAGAASISARLRSARDSRGLSLDDVAARTRVPIRHLQHIENGDWDALPAITYSVGFVRSYANAVGLDGAALGAELREQLGGASGKSSAAPLYEPADPARVPPRSLAIAAGLLALVIAIGYLVWRTSAADEPDALELATAPPPAVAAPVALPAPASRPAPAPTVLVTAIDPVWLRIYEAGGTKLFEGAMQAGQGFEVPASARSPQILTGRPDVIRVTVGETEIPPLGPPNRTIADISLLPQDLLARTGSSGGDNPAGAAVPATIAPGPVAR